MRKGLVVLLALLFLGAGTLPVSALEEYYSLDEPDVRFALPDGYAAITRDTQPDDPVFDRLGLDGPELLEFMQTNNIYLDAFLETDLMQELTVTMTAQPGLRHAAPCSKARGFISRRGWNMPCGRSCWGTAPFSCCRILMPSRCAPCSLGKISKVTPMPPPS